MRDYLDIEDEIVALLRRSNETTKELISLEAHVESNEIVRIRCQVDGTEQSEPEVATFIDELRSLLTEYCKAISETLEPIEKYNLSVFRKPSGVWSGFDSECDHI